MTDVAIPEAPSHVVTFSDQQIDTLRRTIARDANETELNLFVSQCKRTQLDPFVRQIYFMKTRGRPTIVVSIDGFRLIAARSGVYGGQTQPQWCGEDGEWKDVWLSDDPPAASRVGVYRQGVEQPSWGVVTWKEFGQGKTSTWEAMPSHMLAKVAESHALRKAFPNEMSGLYSADEMQAAGAAVMDKKLTSQETAQMILKTCDLVSDTNRQKIADWVTESTGVPFTLDGLMSLPAENGEQILEQARKARNTPDATAEVVADAVPDINLGLIQELSEYLDDEGLKRFESWNISQGIDQYSRDPEQSDLLKMHSWLRAELGQEPFLEEPRDQN